jgi:pimeloyl-ACP methyl ester carboxylesterase
MDWKLARRWVRIVWVTGGMLFMGWMVWSMQARDIPEEKRRSTAALSVIEGDDTVVFLPTAPAAGRAAVVFLPGGMVDPDSYLPLVRAVADAGWPAAIVELPWRMAFSEAAEEQVWRRVTAVRGILGSERPLVLGGHSRGAAMSARFASQHPDELAGLFLLGTTHPKDDDLSSFGGAVVKVSATRDCVADLEDSLANKRRLPPRTVWVTIEGGNHAQFGYYGQQLGDCAATIDRATQQRHVLASLLPWLSNVAAR